MLTRWDVVKELRDWNGRLVIKDAIEKTLKPIRHMDTEDWLLILT